jgi:anthranilate/para-aminobenzoate synthase component I
MSDMILVLSTALESNFIERDLEKFLGEKPSEDSKIDFCHDEEKIWDKIKAAGAAVREGDSVQVLYTGNMSCVGRKNPVRIDEDLILGELKENNLTNYKKIDVQI